MSAVPVGNSVNCTGTEVEFNVAVTVTVRCVVIGDVKMLKPAEAVPVCTVTGLCG